MVLTLTRLVQVNVVNEEGQTALMWACRASAVGLSAPQLGKRTLAKGEDASISAIKMAQLLLAAGARPELVDDDGKRAYDYAVQPKMRHVIVKAMKANDVKGNLATSETMARQQDGKAEL
jgi:hypothetical protein